MCGDEIGAEADDASRDEAECCLDDAKSEVVLVAGKEIGESVFYNS